MTAQTPTTLTLVANATLWPFITLAVLGLSIALMYVNDNTFLLVPPVMVTVISALRVRSNKWYLLPLIPGAFAVLFMLFALTSSWVGFSA